MRRKESNCQKRSFSAFFSTRNCRCKEDDLEELEEVDLTYLITDTITVKYDTISGVSMLCSTDWEMVGP